YETADTNILILFYLSNITGGPTVITVNYDGTNRLNFCRLVVTEFSGVLAASPLDVGFGGPTVNASKTTTTHVINSADVTTLADGDLIYAAWCQTDASTGINAGSTFTSLVYGANSDVVPMRAEYKIQSSAGSVTSDFTGVAGTHNYLAGMIPLK